MPLPAPNDEFFMRQALRAAVQAFEEGEVPVGALVVQQGRILGRGYNQTEKLKDVTAHAEIIALTSAFATLGGKYLPEATLFVTLEPCHMCAGALYWSKIGRIVFGAADEKHGYQKFYGSRSPFHPKTKLESGLLAEESVALLKRFFAERRG